MQCGEFKQRLNAVLDARQIAKHDPALTAHARQCTECADQLADLGSLLKATAKLPRVGPSATLGLQVLQAIEISKRQRQRYKTWALGILALAGGLLVAVLSWPAAVPNGAEQANNNHRQGRIILAAHYQQFVHEAGQMTSQQLVVVNEVADGFKPVTSPVYSALHALWRAVPGNELAHTLL